MVNKIILSSICLFYSCTKNKIYTYYPNGKIHICAEFSEGKKDGQANVYYQNGFRQMELFYSNDTLTNFLTTFYENSDIEYVVNVSTMQAKLFSRDGQTYMIGKLVNFKRDGFWFQFDRETEEMIYKISFKNNEQNGYYYGYWDEFRVKLVGTFKNGTPDGFFTYFTYDGKVSKVEVWKANRNHKSSDLLKEIIY